jgi:hypothetical protein
MAWIPQPQLHELLQAGDPKVNFILLVGLVIFGFLAAGRSPGPRSSQQPPDGQEEDPASAANSRSFLFVLAALFLAVPFGFWLLAQFGPNLSLPRYSLPMVLGWVLLIALALHRLAIPVDSIFGKRVSLLFSVTFLLVYAPLDASFKPSSAAPRWPAATAAFQDAALRDCVIATADSLTYLPRFAMDFAPKRFVYVCRGAQEMARWHRFNPTLQLADVAEFLRDHSRFILLNDRLDHPEWSRWLELRLQADPAWRVTVLAADGDSLLLLAERK